MRIEFDPHKNAKNITERDLPFDKVADFNFTTALVWQDIRHTYTEPRYVSVGFIDRRLHVLCFTPVLGGVRVISLRKANKREEINYANQKNN